MILAVTLVCTSLLWQAAEDGTPPQIDVRPNQDVPGAPPFILHHTILLFVDAPKKRVPYPPRFSEGGQRHCRRHDLLGIFFLARPSAQHYKNGEFETVAAHGVSAYPPKPAEGRAPSLWVRRRRAKIKDGAPGVIKPERSTNDGKGYACATMLKG
jgi:hypothetical protein